MRRLLRSPWWFTLVLTAAFVGLILWRVDLGEIGEHLREANYWWALLALLVSTGTKVIDTVRWRVYLAKVGQIPFLGLFGAFLIGNLGNNLLPMRGGDVAKIQILANRYGVSRAGLAASVFVVEAVMDGVTFLVLIAIALALLDVPFVPELMLWALAISAGGGFVATVLVSRFFPRDLLERRWFRPLTVRLRRSLGELWPNFLDGLETMRNLRLLGWAVVLNFAGWLSQVLTFWLFGLAFGLDLSFAQYMVIMIAANLTIALPFTFQSLGPYEVVLATIIAGWGLTWEEGFAYAAATHMLTNFWVIAVGLVTLVLMRVRPREVFAVRRVVPEAEAVVPEKTP